MAKRRIIGSATWKFQRRQERLKTRQMKANSGVVYPRPLPETLVKRLRAIVSKNASEWSKKMSKMKSIDHRGKQPKPRLWGERVREMNVSRNFPGIRLVVKKGHMPFDSKFVVDTIKEIVKDHNNTFKPKEYELVEMPAEFLGYGFFEDFIAMPKVDAPTVYEMRHDSTVRGKRFTQLLKKFKFSLKQLESAAKIVEKRTGISPDNLVFLGLRKGKFVFMPLADLK